MFEKLKYTPLKMKYILIECGAHFFIPLFQLIGNIGFIMVIVVLFYLDVILSWCYFVVLFYLGVILLGFILSYQTNKPYRNLVCGGAFPH